MKLSKCLVLVVRHGKPMVEVQPDLDLCCPHITFFFASGAQVWCCKKKKNVFAVWLQLFFLYFLLTTWRTTHLSMFSWGLSFFLCERICPSHKFCSSITESVLSKMEVNHFAMIIISSSSKKITVCEFNCETLVMF